MKYLALDIGNVLCEVDFYPFLSRVSEMMNLPENEVMAFINRIQKLHDVGLTTLEEELRDRLGLKSEPLIQDAAGAWDMSVYANQNVVDFVSDLQEKHNVKVALLSNIGFEHARIMPIRLSPIYSDIIEYFSCDVGVRKPSSLYYSHFLNQHPEFKGCVYVDDLALNRAVAEMHGFKSFDFSLNYDDKPIDEYLSDIKMAVLGG